MVSQSLISMKYLINYFLFLLLGFSNLMAQETVISSGGNASGAGGSVSYSIGQVSYETNTGTTGSVAQGVQHAYEIYAVTGVEIKSISLNISVFPNPTQDYLTLSIEELSAKAQFQLFDIQGKLLQSARIVELVTTINVDQLPSSTYFFKIFDNQQEIKTFKIIKT